MHPDRSVSPHPIPRALGLMVVHSPRAPVLDADLSLAQTLGAKLVELLPRWNVVPSAETVRDTIESNGLAVWSVHGPWGGQSIRADRVDLADTNPRLRQESIDDAVRASDWAAALGAKVLVVHPGGLSAEEAITARSDNLRDSLARLAANAWPMGLKIGVENMPRGVFPGSRMEDLATIVREIGHPALGLVLDTGHARIVSDPTIETLASAGLLISTHVHDNDGRADSHRPPGEGVVDWPAWFHALDRIAYGGPVMLECVRALRESDRPLEPAWVDWWQGLVSGAERVSKTCPPFRES